MGDKHLLVKKNNRAGYFTLNRPNALNALSLQMFETLSRELGRWQKDPEIYGVVLDAVGDKVFCAGGDLKEVVALAQQSPERACAFLAREYQYNWQLEKFTKPHVALMNGVVLGGGVGISLYGTHRVAGEKFRLAMPETAIGFVPDVGGSWFLGHMPYSTGLYLALTGRSIGRADAYDLGLVTHCVDESHFATIRAGMSEGEPIDTVLDGLHEAPGKGELKPLHGWIEAVFSASSLAEIFERAQSIGKQTKGWSLDVLDELRQKSPTSLLLTHRLWKKGRHSTLRSALQREYRVVASLMREPDFFEGVRAMIMDKDKAPNWKPPHIEDLSKQEIEALMNDRGAKLELETESGFMSC